MPKQTLSEEVRSYNITTLRLTEIYSKAKKDEKKEDLMIDCLRNNRMPLDILKEAYNNSYYNDKVRKAVLNNDTVQTHVKALIDSQESYLYSTDQDLIKGVFKYFHPITICEFLTRIQASEAFQKRIELLSECIAMLYLNERIKADEDLDQELVGKVNFLVDKFDRSGYKILISANYFYSNALESKIHSNKTINAVFHILKDKALQLLASEYATVPRLSSL